jgi:16S rRNA (cytidine1402-2'-O)-methyltransferase
VTELSALAQNQHYPPGTLYLVATPIGNAADITLRALHLLALADRIAAEDTRNTAQLLARYGISKPLLAAHEHNEHAAAQRIVEALRAGERVACVSDAGTPGISDPGARIVDAVRVAGLPVVALPGACALTTALSAAGSWVASFTFIGFLPARAKQREQQLRTLADHAHALVFYEAPHRIVAVMASLRAVFGDKRRVLIARELTKLHEALTESTLAEAPAWLCADDNRQRGEFVLVVEGAPPPETGQAGSADADRILRILLEELPVSAAARAAAALTGAPRDALYARALTFRKD